MCARACMHAWERAHACVRGACMHAGMNLWRCARLASPICRAGQDHHTISFLFETHQIRFCLIFRSALSFRSPALSRLGVEGAATTLPTILQNQIRYSPADVCVQQCLILLPEVPRVAKGLRTVVLLWNFLVLGLFRSGPGCSEAL